MTRESLGLFDRPPSRNEIRAACAIVGLALLASLLIIPSRNAPVVAIDAFVPVLNSIMFVGELIIGTLLYGQAAVFRSRALVVLGSVYVFGTLMLIPHALTFPGAFAPGGLLGAGMSTTAYFGVFWRIAFPLGIIGYALLVRRDIASPADPRQVTAWIHAGIFAAAGSAIAASLLATLGHDLLPPLFVDRRHISFDLYAFTVGTVVLAAAAMGLLVRRFRSVLDMWLMTALACSLIQAILNVFLDARFTVGWYGLWLLLLVSNLIVTLALLMESNAVYARLALSSAAHRREREARLMSMDAVTAAISHEVGQPLSAVSLNAAAAMNWLSEKKPDVQRAVTSLAELRESVQRSFDIIRSIRAAFAKEPGGTAEFSLNELIREATALLDRELVADKVSLDLVLDERLHPVVADRVQIQRVLVNIIMNAIESMRGVSAGNRSISIRSKAAGGGIAVIQISDTGIGIAGEDLEHIFDAFFTTKTTGTGLGLALCRTIIEEHGGRLWATAREPHGANFYIELPRNKSDAVYIDGTGQLLQNLETSLSLVRQSTEHAELTAELERVIAEVRASLMTKQ